MQALVQELQDLIVSALEDPVRRVQMAAAVCQYVMRKPNSQAKDILQSTLKQGEWCPQDIVLYVNNQYRRYKI